VKNLAVAITEKNEIDISRVNKLGLKMELKKYSIAGGGINYPELFKIPVSERIWEMSKKNLGGTIKLIAVALTLALETINVARKMTSSQILDLAEEIVVSSEERDNIGIEDLMMFLQKLTRGEYAELYEGIDQVKFMARFDVYRDERWEAAIAIRDNKIEEYKKLGDDNLYARTYVKDWLYPLVQEDMLVKQDC